MQQIERYGVIALLFMIVTFVTVSLWDGGEEEPQEVATATKRVAAPVVSRQRPAPNRSDPILTQRPIPERGSGRRQVPLGGDRATPQLEPERFADSGHNTYETSVAAGGDGPVSQGYQADPGRIRHERARYNSEIPSNVSREDVAAENKRMREEYERVKLANPDPEPKGSTGATREYFVKPGDSLERIARRELGDGKRWKEIQTMNGGVDPLKLMVGAKLKLGEPSTPSEAPAKSAEPKREAAPGPKVATATYTVKRGDVLGRIAQRELGSATLWEEIVALNPGVDPNRLLVGAVLKLPKAARPVQQPRRELVASAVIPKSSRPRVR